MTDEENSRPLSATCQVCDAALTPVLDLPGLPLTGIYTSQPDTRSLRFDQELLVCPECTHGQLRHAVRPRLLYGGSYGFRTSRSVTASAGAAFFAEFLDRVCPGRTFSRVLEFGCNDAHLLSLIQHKAERLLGVDPIWEGREPPSGEKLRLVGGTLESVDPCEILGDAPDLVLSQHTLEHVAHPRTLLAGLVDMCGRDTLFVHEFPCFDVLLDRLRFDQVFHQHLQYFSLRSFLTLIGSLGCEPISYAFNYSHWGALLIAFRKAASQRTTRPQPPNNYREPPKTPSQIRERYVEFRAQLAATGGVVRRLDRQSLYGYGAALMLPVLAYHLETDFSELQGILDDDPSKSGLRYPGLAVSIRTPEDLSMSNLSVLLTAIDNRRPIIRRLVDAGVRNIVNPLHLV